MQVWQTQLKTKWVADRESLSRQNACVAVTLTVGAWDSQAAPSLQRCGVAEPTKSWGLSIPIHVQSPHTHWQTKTNAGEWRERPEMRNEKETYLRYQISHFHNSTFLNKLSRLSHQTSLPSCSPPCFIYVLIPHCRGPLLRECPIVSKHWS